MHGVSKSVLDYYIIQPLNYLCAGCNIKQLGILESYIPVKSTFFKKIVKPDLHYQSFRDQGGNFAEVNSSKLVRKFEEFVRNV